MKRIILLFAIIASVWSFGQSDCSSSLAVCGNSDISYTPTGHGEVTEDLGGCLTSDEHFSVWYSFTAGTNGTITFVITPNAAGTDYDWAVYGPNVNCNSLGTPIRCSYASIANSGPGGTTGLNDTATDTTEGAGQGADGFCQQLTVTAGETYYLVVDNFSVNANGFSLTWGGTASLTTPFNDTIQPNPFIAPGPAQNGVLTICSTPQEFDFSTLTAGIINGNANFGVTYHLTSNDALLGTNPITNPINVNEGITYFYAIKYTDPDDPDNSINDCVQTGEITFVNGNVTLNNATLAACNNNKDGVGLFNLDTATVYGGTVNITKEYYPSLADLNAGTNLIANPQLYQSAEGSIFVKVTTEAGCTNTAEITLQFLPVVETEDKEIFSCFIPDEPSTALFDLTSVDVVNVGGLTLEYYASEQDAIDGNNPIGNPANYISVSTEIFVKAINQSGCYDVAKITLNVKPPTYSEILKDKIICLEDVTRLDAGADFDAYLWSTGSTDSSISNVTVGTYWVDLTKNSCVTRQEVKVIASPVPVITDVKIKENRMEVMVEGGTQPYQYSLDGATWQDSNIFEGLTRGQNFVYVKDAYDCEPVKLEVTIPNLINVITPNGDGYNDEIDYSELAYKKDLNFAIYDRYENKIFQNSKSNKYTWDGRFKGGKKVPTGTYWYVISWKNPTTGTPFVYKGWIMVKNR